MCNVRTLHHYDELAMWEEEHSRYTYEGQATESQGNYAMTGLVLTVSYSMCHIPD